MNLANYYNKKVQIIANNKKVFIGTVSDYSDSYDNENGKESIVVDSDKSDYPIEFYEKDISSITVIG